jgi:glycosyltransferase involved in cell wall biosynthesis
MRKLGSWVFPLYASERVSGIERVMLELHQSINQLVDSSFEFSGVLPKKSLPFAREIKLKEIAADALLSKELLSIDFIDCLLIAGIDHPSTFLEILEAKKRRLRVVSLIHDTLPLRKPDYFPFAIESRNTFLLWLMGIMKVSDCLIFTSRIELEHFESFGFNFPGEKVVIELGESIKGAVLPSRFRNDWGILAVSTLEPRKGYADLLDAFDLLKTLGYPITLHIVGRYGWDANQIRDRILDHQEYGSSLFWHSECDDDDLESLYRATSVSVIPSMEEGWGLNLEEGLRHGHKIVARDIPIFRMREQENVTFFDNFKKPLAEAILESVEREFTTVKARRSMKDTANQILAKMIENS